jgi:hypothetical protein
VWPVIVVVLRVLGQDVSKMLLAVDQQVVEALTAQRSDQSLRERVGRRRRLHLIQMVGTGVSG